MFVRTVTKRRLLTALHAPALLAMGVLLLRYPAAVSTGISRGLSVCTGVIIPTLYPFMLLAGLLADSPLCRRPGKVAQAVSRWLFGLPGCCGAAVLLALVGGYPAGAVAVGRLHRMGLISDSQAARMAAFCVCGGPGFIVGTVGAGLLGSVQAGALLYAAQAAACVAAGCWLGRGHRQQAPSTAVTVPPPRPLAAVVGDTCGALLTMCGFVVLAATGLSLLEAMGIPTALQGLGGTAAGWSAVFAAITEVSCGCIALVGSGELAPFWLSVAMGWAGLSVQGQLAAALPGVRVLGPGFWSWRLVCGTLAGAMSMGLFALFPHALDTMGSGVIALPHQVSAAASIMLLLLSFLAMLCFSSKKGGNLSQDVIE